MAGGDGNPGDHGADHAPGCGRRRFTDTVELRITGTADAPALQATGVDVEVDRSAPRAFRSTSRQFFPEKVALPIVAGAPQC